MCDHRRGLWIVADGSLLWCYQCGAIRPNRAGRLPWAKPTGNAADNPYRVCEKWEADRAAREAREKGETK
jgi:hypothetical protein